MKEFSIVRPDKETDLKEVFQKKKGSAFEFFFFYVWG
jgi:hypothetical protein